MQTSPLTFMAIFEACRLILAPKHMFPLILIGLRILKWGETFLKVNFGIIYGYFKGPGGNSMWLRPSQKLLVYQKISGFKVVPHQNWMPSFIAFKNLQFLRFPKWGVTYL